ncbi:MAG: hypothetical protein RBS80_26975 [Thermoguttaceae bacterium]|jgi:uncharacterized membrane protein|nr:hypothetical protein [Thermoguttaceae bacterium]
MRLTLNPITDSYLLVFAAAAVLFALLLVRPRAGTMGRWRQVGLVALRAGVIALVLLLMLRPTLVYTETTRQAATLVMLIDRSRSMSVRDMLRGKSRWAALEEALQAAAADLRQIAREFELRVYAFDRTAQRLDAEGGAVTLPKEPTGEQTAIGAALEEVLRQEAGKRLLGVLLLSDGAQRAYPPYDTPPQTAAAALRRLGYPMYTFPFGQSRGLGQAQDVAVTKLLASPTVFVKNRLAVGGEVRADGYVNRSLPVRLLFETEPGKMEVVAQQDLQVTTSGQLLPVQLDFAPQLPGEYKLTLEVPPQPGELVTTNNQRSTFVNVLPGGLSVLYLEGSLRVEQRFIRRALDASPDIQVDYVRIDAQKPETRPGDLAERFKPGKYQVILLGDLDSTAFTEPEMNQLAESVRRGTGLIMLGGFHSFGPGGYATTPLAQALPVGMDRFARQQFDAPIREDAHVPGPLSMMPTPLGLGHFSLLLSADRRANQSAWSKLPPLEGANKLDRARLAPGALELAAAGDAPLLVAHTYGAGRVMAFAADSTWRWWMQGFDSEHKRFWRQIVLWLARKDESIEGNVWVRLERRQFAPAERVDFTVGAQAATGEPLKDARFEARLVVPGGAAHPLELARQDAEMLGAVRDAKAPGDYAIEVTATHDGQPLGSSRARFLVFEQDLELDNPGADAATMQSLASLTGGESLAPEELPALIRRLAAETDELLVERETKRSLWDTWSMFLTLVGLLSAEWFLRKRWGLV